MSSSTRFVAPLMVASLFAGCAADPAPPLPALQVDTQRVAVAGLSSGAYMATQVHVALNARVQGAALFAGGPYGCAQGSLEQALGPCMLADPAPDVASLVSAATQRAKDGLIDAATAFAGDRVLIVHGEKDLIVSPKLATVSADFYQSFSEGLVVPVIDRPASLAHTFPTLSAGSSCETAESPWLGACGIDGARQAMVALFGALSEGQVEGQADGPAEARGVLSAFDQGELIPDGGAAGIAETGYVYVPAECADAACGVLMVFHGCQQNAESIGEAFVRETGFNRWADQHRVVVVYPQTQSSYVPLNPKACWDWWGYSGTNYDTREGEQVRFVAAMLDRLEGRR